MRLYYSYLLISDDICLYDNNPLLIVYYLFCDWMLLPSEAHIMIDLHPYRQNGHPYKYLFLNVF